MNGFWRGGRPTLVLISNMLT